MVYTSYYDRIPQIKSAEFVSISRYPPSKWEGLAMKFLAPSPQLFAIHDQITTEEYKRRYLDEIKSLDISLILSALESTQEISGKDVVLLCYEKPDEVCHRQWLAEYINYRVPGYIQELGV